MSKKLVQGKTGFRERERGEGRFIVRNEYGRGLRGKFCKEFDESWRRESVSGLTCSITLCTFGGNVKTVERSSSSSSSSWFSISRLLARTLHTSIAPHPRAVHASRNEVDVAGDMSVTFAWARRRRGRRAWPSRRELYRATIKLLRPRPTNLGWLRVKKLSDYLLG